jgi:hypothetical protein
VAWWEEFFQGAWLDVQRAMYTREQNEPMQQRTNSIRVYTYAEPCAIAKAAGFARCDGVDGLTLEPSRVGSRRLWFVATKA